MKDQIFLILGRSGCGKSTLADGLESKGYKQLPSYTTRKMRDGEINGKDHRFITEEEFFNLEIYDGMVAKTIFDGHHYGVTRKDISLFDTYIIDKIGMLELKERIGDEVDIYSIYLPSNVFTVAIRMLKRGDGFKKVISRICHDMKAFKGLSKQCDYVLPRGMTKTEVLLDVVDYICYNKGVVND